MYLKDLLSEKENSLDRLNYRMETAEERITELEEINQSEEEGKGDRKKNE